MDSSVELQEAVFDELPEPVAILNEQARIVDTNQAWTSLGNEADVNFLPPTLGDDLRSHLEQSSSEGTTEIAAGIRAVLQADQESFTKFSPFADGGLDRQFFLQVVGFTHDGSRRALIVLVDVSEAKQDCLTARERARRAESALRIIAHDLRTPLNVIDGHAELLQEELGEDLQSLDKIQSASARANTIIDDALSLLGGFAATEREEVSLKTVAEGVWADLDQLHDQASLRIDGSFRFKADAGLLHRVFENLFVNAIEHAGPQVTVRVGRLPELESSTVGFFVEDDGPGLPDSEVGNIFNPGYTSDSAGGYGLGLTIVQTISEGHGWAVSATNGESGGARFEVSGIHPA